MAILQTARLELRPFLSTDLDRLSDLMANRDFMKFSSGPFSREQTKAFLDKVMDWDRQNLPSQSAVILASEERLIGYCGFFHQEVDQAAEIEIGYRLDPEFWGQGIATEAAKAVRDHAFGALGLERVISLIHPDNIASRRVAEKNGMSAEKETVFRGFPTVVWAAHHRNGDRS